MPYCHIDGVMMVSYQDFVAMLKEDVLLSYPEKENSLTRWLNNAICALRVRRCANMERSLHAAAMRHLLRLMIGYGLIPAV